MITVMDKPLKCFRKHIILEESSASSKWTFTLLCIKTKHLYRLGIAYFAEDDVKQILLDYYFPKIIKICRRSCCKLQSVWKGELFLQAAVEYNKRFYSVTGKKAIKILEVNTMYLRTLWGALTKKSFHPNFIKNLD